MLTVRDFDSGLLPIFGDGLQTGQTAFEVLAGHLIHVHEKAMSFMM
jgi:hypothetical protein